MICVNGVPKSGTHALMALLSRAGLKRCPGTVLGCTPDQELHVAGAPAITLSVIRMLPHNVFILAHVCAAHAAALDGVPVITVFRDPRDCLTSYCRYRLRMDGVRATIPDAIQDFWGKPFVDVYRGFLGWRGKSAIMRYEDLPEHVVGTGSGIYGSGDQAWNTRTGAPSEWEDDWSRDDHRAFRTAGGCELVAEAGYQSARREAA